MDTLSKSKIKEEVENLREEIDQQTKFIYNIRRRYEKLVDKLYQLEPPFPQPRSGSEEELISDFEQIDEMVTHCIRLDNTELLEKHLINPVSTGELSMKTNEMIKRLNVIIEIENNKPDAPSKGKNYLKWIVERLA
ncbi:MAG: hypothetical protein SVR94_18195 [Pseudomonadota bacterium]|nr:hypothetical protein [Pseudomonadota bacterium]